MRYSLLFATASMATLVAAAALADPKTSSEPPSIAINALPKSGNVTVSGKIEKVHDNREFTLRDKSGSINVRVASNDSEVMKEGDTVSVTGNVETGFFGGKDIVASKVEPHKDLSTALGDVVTKATGLSVDQAKTVQIQQLPAEGMVKLSGTVNEVKNEKDFTLKDATGSVDVSLQSDEKAVLAKGAEVTVIGYVHSGLLGKDIRATHVIVNADTTANAGGSPAR